MSVSKGPYSKKGTESSVPKVQEKMVKPVEKQPSPNAPDPNQSN